MSIRMVIVALMSGVMALLLSSTTRAISCDFMNPLIPAGQDPSVVFFEGYYYLVQSNAGSITIAKSTTITGLGVAEPITVYRPPSGEPYSYDMWAPELVVLDGVWYIYVAATEAPGANATHRMYVLQANTTDPQGSWTMMGKVYDPAADKWAIDGVVFEYQDQLYMVWSGWPGDEGDFPQNLYIAPMSDPLTISGPRRLIAEPDQSWEHSVAALLEGPEPYIHNGQLSIVYSADASWTRAYKLGVLVLTGDDLLERASWEKVGPVFSESEGIYGPGHNGMPVPSPDGSEFWHLYHAKTSSHDGWDDRAIFAQRFTWNADGTPDFGKPVPFGVVQTVPSGEPCGLVAAGTDVMAISATTPAIDDIIQLDNDFIDTGMSWINTQSSFAVGAWVQIDVLGQPSTILSQDGGITSNFVLQYTGEGFAFTLYDPFGTEPISAQVAFDVVDGQWVHVMGVKDMQNGAARLYIDGALRAQIAVDSDAWAALGNTIIGAMRRSTQRINMFSGAVKGVRLYQGILEAAEIQEMSNMVE